MMKTTPENGILLQDDNTPKRIIRLDLKGMSLTDLDVSELSYLEELDCSKTAPIIN